MNPNPHQARRARIERKQDALHPIATAMNEAIEAARQALADDDTAMRLRAAHAISQLCGSYVKLYEAIELESRMESIEQQISESASRN